MCTSLCSDSSVLRAAPLLSRRAPRGLSEYTFLSYYWVLISVSARQDPLQTCIEVVRKWNSRCETVAGIVEYVDPMKAIHYV
jgi:hypothetical protein